MRLRFFDRGSSHVRSSGHDRADDISGHLGENYDAPNRQQQPKHNKVEGHCVHSIA
jgi:hypothetical protein